MADDVIFFRDGEDLVPLAVAEYEAEAVLQELLERHPQLLAGAQMNRIDPRRFLLVKREAPVADHDGGSGRWSIDHLFLDHDAVPTLIEVKRSSDTRIRREVVGQMLDYAANGVRYWAPDQLQQMFEKSCAESGLNPSDTLAKVIGEVDVADFWSRAGRNLRGGSLRLVFVADVIPGELRAIIEFLNGRMPDTEVYGVEVKRYVGNGGHECFVPRLIGAIEKVEAARRAVSSQSLDELFAQAGPAVVEVRERLALWAEQRGVGMANTPKSMKLFDVQGTMAYLYPTFRSLDVSLELLWRVGRESDIAETVVRMQAIAPSKKVSEKQPNITCDDALRHWDEVVAILNWLLSIRVEIASQTSAKGSA
ncbi:MAG: hypothetical protein ACYDD4_03580 [Acidimicrobiales bacterium]